MDVVLPVTFHKPKLGTSKRGGHYTPVEKASISRHFRWYLRNLKLPPIEVCENYIREYPNNKGRSAKDMYYHVRNEVNRTKKRYGV